MAQENWLEKDGFAFKNLAGKPELLPYEDWRLSPHDRAQDLASRLSVEEIAGLMLYSSHQMVPFPQGGPFQGHYHGRAFAESGESPWALTDEQQNFIQKDHIRHVLMAMVENAETSARWSNALQALAEKEPWGIPINISSDPRHGVAARGAEFKSGGSDVSKWPDGVGLAAAFSPALVRQFADIASREYRALGITTALSPQVDLATDPRWMRFEDTFGGDCTLVTECAKAYCDGMQTTQGVPGGWGKDSVAAMAKHWPGGGTGEGGRDAHYAFGQFAVYPGNRFATHLKPFTEGVFRLDGPTGKAASIMPYYTVSWNQDTQNGENVGNSYSRYLIHDLLRGKYGYDGILCTDWGITGDPESEMDSFGSRCYGVRELTEGERHLRILMNGVDQFGGNNRIEPVLEAYWIGCQKYGGEAMRHRMEESAVRLLTSMFRLGLFENPYLEPQESKAIVGCREFVNAGLEAQRRSVVLLKNRNAVLPLSAGLKLYVPDRTVRRHKNFFRGWDEPHTEKPVTPQEAEGYFTLVETPEQADAALVFMESPLTDAYSAEDVRKGGNGYLPISLQYRPYTAAEARDPSIAGGDFREPSANRTYRGKTNTAANESDLDSVLETRRRMGEKPVIVCLRQHNPTVPAEWEPAADAVITEFGVQRSVLFDLLFGRAAPQGRLPFLMPADMAAVEHHCEDVPDDMKAYTDEAGNTYAFGFGLHYNQ
jgi:beta-glucosidase